VPYHNCACGLTYDPTVSPDGCPKCGKSSAPTAAAAAPSARPVEEKIRFSCTHCGLRLTAAAKESGKNMTCLACGRLVAVPAVSAPEPVRSPGTTARRPAAAKKPAASPDGWRSKARWSLFAALIPLAFYTFMSTDDLKDRIQETEKLHPEFAKRVRQKRSVDDVLSVLPGERLEGAMLARPTKAHWVMAILAALIFWEFILIVQPMGTSTSKQLWAVGIFTGTIGILMLLIVQLASIVVAYGNLRGGCILAPLFLVLRFIGFSYGAAINPENGFFLSMVGFTLGVGLMEEFFKALPVFWHHRRTGTLDLRGSVVWGLATGIGFGVSEGMSYCKDFYNGLHGGGIYVVRFISCVALHAVWSATVSILIWRRREAIQAIAHWWEWFAPIAGSLWISMIIHGFYDTVLKKEYGGAALASGVLSFALFFWLYDRACREEALHPAPAAA
jgi:RsiW-degrading membrane proteinase PrsW (M82 family)